MKEMNSLKNDFTKYLATADSSLLLTNNLLQQMDKSQKVEDSSSLETFKLVECSGDNAIGEPIDFRENPFRQSSLLGEGDECWASLKSVYITAFVHNEQVTFVVTSIAMLF